MGAALIFVVLRSPKLLFHGRIFAEEGTVYLQDAWNRPFLPAFLAPHQGYYSLLDNAVASIAAHLLPLSWAAFLFTFSALGILLLLVVCVVACELFETVEARLLAALICVVSPSLEVWLTLEDAQFCLAAAVAIVLLSNSDRLRTLRCFVVVLGGLTGPVSCALLPFAWIRAIAGKNRNAALQATLLTGCAGIQAACLMSAVHHGERAVVPATKLAWLGPVFLTKIVCVTFGTRVSFFLFVRLLLDHGTTLVFTMSWMLAIAGMACLLYLANLGGSHARWLLALACWSFLFAYLGCAEPTAVLLGGANRYFFLPDLLIWLMILVVWQRNSNSPEKARSRLTNGVLALILCAGLLDSAGYWSKNQTIAAPWSEQVAAWQQDPDRALTISPATWETRVHLNPKR